MNTIRVNTRFMQGNKTDEIFDLLADYYGMGAVCSDEIDWCEAIFSDGFILAIKSGLIPILGSQEVSFGARNSDVEFHHIIYNEECYKIYFKKVEN